MVCDLHKRNVVAMTVFATSICSQWILATDISRTLDTTVDPCENFYDFACGNYSKQVTLLEEESSMNFFVEADKTLTKQLKLMLQEPISSQDKKPAKWAKMYYTSCMDVGELEKLGLQPMKSFIASYGGWPMVEGNRWKAGGYDWLKVAARTYRELGMSMILYFSVQTDMKNTTRRLLAIDQPALGLGTRDYYLEEENKEILDAYRNYILSTAVQLGADEAKARSEINKLIDFETRLANISVRGEDRRNITEVYNPMTMAQLKKQHPEIKFDSWLYSMSENGWEISDDQFVDVNGGPYLKQLGKVLSDTDTRTLANYQVGASALNMVPYLAPSLRENSRLYQQALYGTSKFSERWEECIDQTREDLEWPIGSLYVKQHFKPNAKTEMDIMVKHLRNAMRDRIQAATWMDDETKARAQQKLVKIVDKIGYPDYIYNETKILENYDGVEIKEKRYFANVLSTQKTTFNEGSRILHQLINKSEWNISPATLTPFKRLVFPAGILQPPFFIVNAPGYINYARIGSLIGHEITHGYDDQGRQFDGDGNLNLWWSTDTLKKYTAGTKCFIDQYGSIKDKQTGLHLNGELEVGENTADNGGIKNAYAAYQLWRTNQSVTEPAMPGLADYTPDQMFFISYAQQWCDVVRKEFRSTLIVTDPHAPSDYRVNVPLQNYPEFLKAFKCPSKSGMNPTRKCSIW